MRDRDLDEDLKNDPQAKPNKDRPRPLHPESSEADYLLLQQEHAKAAIGRVMGEIKQKLARKHPYAEWLKQIQFKLE